MGRLMFLVLGATMSAITPLFAAQSVTLTFGEWPTARGSRAIYTLNTQRFVSHSQVFLNGNAVEEVVLAKTNVNSLTISAGPILGWFNEPEGTKMYGGVQVDLSSKWAGTQMLARFMTRQTAEQRLHQAVILALDRHVKDLTFGLGYQPIRRTVGKWDHRLSGKISTSLRQFSLSLEVRQSLLADHRISTQIDVIVPLK